MFPKLTVTLVLFLCGLGFGGTSHAKENITWPYICFYPLYICQDKQLVGGAGWNIMNLMWKNMPDYEHKTALLPLKRIQKDMKQGKHCLFYGLFKTPERQEFMRFSLPCRISPPTMVVIRKEDLPIFGGGKTVSLQGLLENKGLRFLTFNAISYGDIVDKLLAPHEKNENVHVLYRTDEMDQNALGLLRKKRIDYFLALNGTHHVADEMGIAGEIVLLPIKEQSEYKVGYITAPKNEWGKQMIEKVNRVLRKQIPTEYFFNLYKPLVSDNMLPELRVQFNKLIVEPSKQ